MKLSRTWTQHLPARSLAAKAYKRVRNRIPHDVWARLRARTHPALRHKAALLTRTRLPSHGRVSVIVPCYRVERYLPSCLNSLIRQTYADLEIIVVIDGSPDRSADIAREYARWDRRVRVVEQPNAGLGAARNTGVRHAHGDFVTFVDSDDDLPKTAYAKMVDCLTRSGSDFVVGGIQRRQGSRTWLPRWAEEVHRVTRTSLRLEDYPEVLADVFACNKIFRTRFFLDHVSPFPEGVRYEDQVPSARAYTAARSFDVIHDVVYTWYVRSDGTSLSQQKGSAEDLRDRLRAIEGVADVLSAEAGAAVRSSWAAKTLGLDLGSYYYVVPRTGEDFWKALRETVRKIARDADQRAWERIDLHDRLLARLVVEGRRDDVCTAVRRREELGAGCVRVDRSVTPPVGRPLYLAELGWQPTDSELGLGPELDVLRTSLVGYHIDADVLELTVAAWLPGSSSDESQDQLSCRVVRGTLGQDRPYVRGVVERTLEPGFSEATNEAAAIHRSCGYRLRFPLDEVASEITRAPNASDDGHGDVLDWHVDVTLQRGSGTWTSRLLTHDRRWTANRLPASPVRSDGTRIVAKFVPTVGLRLGTETPLVVAERASLTDRVLRLTLRHVPPAHGRRAIRVENKYLGLRHRVVLTPGSSACDVTLLIPPLPLGANQNRTWRWTVTAEVDGKRLPVHHQGSRSQLETDEALSRQLRLSVADDGRLQCAENVRRTVVTGVHVAADRSSFTVRGLAALPDGERPCLALVGTSSGIWAPRELTYDPRTSVFAATFFPFEDRWSCPDVPLPTDGWSLRLLEREGSLERTIWVPVATSRILQVEEGFLAWHENERSAFRFTVTARARALWVNTRPPLGPSFGRYAQRRLQEQIPTLLRAPLREAVLFSSYNGKSASDSPLEIHRELQHRGLDAELLWAVADHGAQVPAGARTVLVDTAEYYECLHTSRYLVNNNNFPYYYTKHQGQVYLQTWHGTPLKRIGNDVPSANLSLSYRSLMLREADAWDFLLAQNPFAADVLPHAFGYHGEVLCSGYPRNDILVRDDPELVDAVRQRVGIRPGQRVVLYAPTWRDTAKTSTGRYAFVNYLELDKVSRAFGDDTILLVRGHSNTPGMTSAATPANVVDVSTYPDVAELLLVSDALVTDYSSIMFDFAVTGRPMVFLVPDIEEYAGTTRGFYLDFREIAPGPLHATTEQVLASLASLANLAAEQQDRYRSFRHRFTPKDDGQAASRIVDAVWGRS